MGVRLQPYSERGWLLDFASDAARAAVLEAAKRRPPPALAEWVTGVSNLLLLFKRPMSRSDIEAWLASVETSGADSAEGTHHWVPVRYDGEDLRVVAEKLGATADEVISLHSAPVYRVETMGFSPGFPYLSGLHPRLRLPRKDTPRPRIPAGSVAIGGDHAGIYPAGSPGGWHLLGTTDFPLFRPEKAMGERLEPREIFALAPGDRVSFVPVP